MAPLACPDTPSDAPAETPPFSSAKSEAITAAESVISGLTTTPGQISSDAPALDLARKHFTSLSDCLERYSASFRADPELSALRGFLGIFSEPAAALPDAGLFANLPPALARRWQEPAVASVVLHLHPAAYALVPPRALVAKTPDAPALISRPEAAQARADSVFMKRLAAEDPTTFRYADKLRSDTEFALRSIAANASNFDHLPPELQQDPEFRRRALSVNSQIARQWSYYEHATPTELATIFRQVLRSPSLLAGMPPEAVVAFFQKHQREATFDHFRVLDDGMLCFTLGKLIDRRVVSFGDGTSAFGLASVLTRTRPVKLFADPAAAVRLFNDPDLFPRSSDTYARGVAIRDAVPPDLWADVSYVETLLRALDIPDRSFPFQLFAPEVLEAGEGRIWQTNKIATKMDGSSTKIDRDGKIFLALGRVASLADLSSSPELVRAIGADLDLVRSLPLAAQRDPELMAFLLRRFPDIAERRLLSGELWSDMRIIRAYHEATGRDRDADPGQIAYDRCSLAQMRELAREYKKAVTTDIRFLNRIENCMSEGKSEAKDWRAFYEETYAQERDFIGSLQGFGWQGRASAGKDKSFDRLMVDPEKFRDFITKELKEILPGLSPETQAILKKHGRQIYDVLVQVGRRGASAYEMQKFLSIFREDIKNDPKLASRLSVALVELNKAYGAMRDRQTANEWSALLSESETQKKAREYAERHGIKIEDSKDADPAMALWSAIGRHLDGRLRDYLKTNPPKPGEKPVEVLNRALQSVLGDVSGLGDSVREKFAAALRATFWRNDWNNVIASQAGQNAMIHDVPDEQFAQQMEAVQMQTLDDYAQGLSAEQSLARVASAEYLASAAVSVATSSASLSVGSSVSPLGYPVAADGRLVVESSGSTQSYYVDMAKWTVSSKDGLTLPVRADLGRERIERTVSSLEFLHGCGLSFLRSDAERVFALVRRTDPSMALRPEDGLDRGEQDFLLAKLLPFFGIELPPGAILNDMKDVLMRLNRGTLGERRSGLLSHLVDRGVDYVDADTGEFRIARFETAFLSHARAGDPPREVPTGK